MFGPFIVKQSDRKCYGTISTCLAGREMDIMSLTVYIQIRSSTEKVHC